MQGTKCWCLQLSSGHWTEKETIYEIERNGMKMSLRVIYKFVKNIELVAVDPSKVQTMNSSSEKLPPGQIEDLWNACFDGLVHCNSQIDSHTFESLTNEPGEILFTQNLVETAGYQANSINDELVYRIKTWKHLKK